MSLKTDYKNDSWEGKRKYLLTENDDGTVSLDDVTNYAVIGDIFNSNDINATNKAVNANAQGLVDERNTANSQFKSVDAKADSLKEVKYADFLVSGWSSSEPYSQTVNVEGIKETDEPIVSLYIPSSTPIGGVDSILKAYGCVYRGETGEGNITLYCHKSKPVTDFKIMIKGE